MGIKIIAKHKRATYDYFLEQKFEAGMVLLGTEIKSLRNGKVSIAESFVDLDRNGEVWIQNMLIPLYDFGNVNNHKEDRKRKLLLNHSEIVTISQAISAKGYTLVPTKIYFKDSLVKLEIALGKGKKNYDKRQATAKKDIERKLQRGDFS